jgi:hypothetical protein
MAKTQAGTAIPMRRLYLVIQPNMQQLNLREGTPFNEFLEGLELEKTRQHEVNKTSINFRAPFYKFKLAHQ